MAPPIAIVVRHLCLVVTKDYLISVAPVVLIIFVMSQKFQPRKGSRNENSCINGLAI